MTLTTRPETFVPFVPFGPFVLTTAPPHSLLRRLTAAAGATATSDNKQASIELPCVLYFSLCRRRTSHNPAPCIAFPDSSFQTPDSSFRFDGPPASSVTSHNTLPPSGRLFHIHIHLRFSFQLARRPLPSRFLSRQTTFFAMSDSPRGAGHADSIDSHEPTPKRPEKQKSRRPPSECTLVAQTHNN